MDVPSSLLSQCPECGEESFNRIVKGRAVGKNMLKAVVKCSQCSRVFDAESTIPRQIKVRTIISHLDESNKKEIELAEDWVVRINDEIMVGDTCVQVTGIEVDSESGTIRVDKALPEEIKTLWTRFFDEIIVKVSINKGRKTESIDLIVDPEEVFIVGEIIRAGKIPLKIYKIKVGEKVHHRAGAKAIAKDVVRVYGKKAKPWSVSIVDQGDGSDTHYCNRR